ncbi:Fatty acid conjugase FAC2 B [Artemisia annua]|uniref:Fatty acid conjugase FAC2 B n=1 Tax=Artemisia annua TaxID=35608 RepID=A0A2U1N4S3_ARTAN|nr:Fatty acid conjugase FAC2 B [Artemisia annua]
MGASDDMKLLDRVPTSKPPFEYNDLKKAIPPHCFEKKLFRSLYAISIEILIMFTLYYVASNYFHILPRFLSCVVWPVYWIFQGVMLVRSWTTGHECGHHSFCGYGWLDDTIGYLLHTFILTPYFSFKFSHANHHSHTNSLEYDETHIPKRKSHRLYYEVMNNPIGWMFTILLHITLAYPLYLICNYGGRKYKGLASHFYPQSPIFKNSQRRKVFVSDVGIFIVLYAYYRVVMTQGATWAFYVYGGPWIFMCVIVTIITYLQHNHPSIPHYDSTEWNWIRGALSTIDRDIGFTIIKNKTDNHVVHHLFPSIPRYHAHEATEAIKPILAIANCNTMAVAKFNPETNSNITWLMAASLGEKNSSKLIENLPNIGGKEKKAVGMRGKQ